MSVLEEFRDLILQTGAFDKSKNYVSFDRIWHQPDTLRRCANLICSELEAWEAELLKSGTKKSDLVLLTADSIEGTLGVLPISFFIAEKLGWHTAVWKEYADVRWGTSALLGYKENNATCVMLQDVVDKGTLALRVAQSIKEYSWKFPVYFSAVLNSDNKETGINKTLDKVSLILGERPAFRYIISAQEL